MSLGMVAAFLDTLPKVQFIKEKKMDGLDLIRFKNTYSLKEVSTG